MYFFYAHPLVSFYFGDTFTRYIFSLNFIFSENLTNLSSMMAVHIHHLCWQAIVGIQFHPATYLQAITSISILYLMMRAQKLDSKLSIMQKVNSWYYMSRKIITRSVWIFQTHFLNTRDIQKTWSCGFNKIGHLHNHVYFFESIPWSPGTQSGPKSSRGHLDFYFF